MENRSKRQRVNTTRAKWWDYSNYALYYVTICTQNRECYFGNVVDGKIDLSIIGEIARALWIEIPNHFDYVKLYEYIVMPNHIHGLLLIDNSPNVPIENTNAMDNTPNVGATMRCPFPKTR